MINSWIDNSDLMIKILHQQLVQKSWCHKKLLFMSHKSKDKELSPLLQLMMPSSFNNDKNPELSSVVADLDFVTHFNTYLLKLLQCTIWFIQNCPVLLFACIFCKTMFSLALLFDIHCSTKNSSNTEIKSPLLEKESSSLETFLCRPDSIGRMLLIKIIFFPSKSSE